MSDTFVLAPPWQANLYVSMAFSNLVELMCKGEGIIYSVDVEKAVYDSLIGRKFNYLSIEDVAKAVLEYKKSLYYRKLDALILEQQSSD